MLHRENPVVLIDGGCVLCNRFAKFVIARDPGGLFLFAALGSGRAKEILASCGLASAPNGTVVVVEGGKCLFKSEAILRVLELLPFPYPTLAGALRKIPAFLRDTAYSGIAATRRIIFGRVETCGLLGPNERRRFLG